MLTPLGTPVTARLMPEPRRDWWASSGGRRAGAAAGRHRRRGRGWCPLAAVFCWLGLAHLTWGAEVDEAWRLYLRGDYSQSVALAEKAVGNEQGSEEWFLVLTDGLLATGRYPQALTAVTNGMAKLPRSIRLRWAAHEVFWRNGETNLAAKVVREIPEMVTARAWAYREAADLIVFGQAALEAGADPKRVLDRVFEPVKKAEPGSRDVYLASGGLALKKHDFALAAKVFQEGLKRLPDDPDLHCGLARAYAPGAAALMMTSVEAALKHNSNHVDSLLLLVDHLVDAEEPAEAESLLQRILAVNPWQPEAWAYRAVLAHLRNDPEAEREARRNALKFWPTDPEVDHLIGRKLSQDYRFAEGAAHQRQALEYDPAFLPVRVQLAQDLLRLGQEDEGWRLAREVQEKDGYDVTANNLVTLHDTLAKFTTLTNKHFIVRMTAREAGLYGVRVLALLEKARGELSSKFGCELTLPVLVEIFAEQKDFAVRTFGMPEGSAYLGVCFGPVVTANSPATRPGQPFNWEAMLWHEFCHVITLQLTRNKMPRWLSEGISVFEERQANPAWGERMNPRYREMILEGGLTPVAKMSGAFLTPPTSQHLQFAYYQSSLVVEFLVQRFGREQLTAVLRDLGAGADINAALAKHTVPLPQFEREFAAFAHEAAKEYAPGLDWEKPDWKTTLPGGEETGWAIWGRTHPTNFHVMTRQARQAIESRRWAEAKAVLEPLAALNPEATGPDSAAFLLASVHRALGETAAERQVLSQLAGRDEANADAYLRLMELSAEAEDWPAVVVNANRYLAVNPLVVPPYRFLAQAADQLDDAPTAIFAYRALLQLDPPNPAKVHFQLARQLHRVGDPAARRQVLQALEEAPRYREALQLLRQMSQPGPTAGVSPFPGNGAASVGGPQDAAGLPAP